MARASWRKGKPLDAFASGYRPHRTDRRAVHEWTVARLRRHTHTQMKRWLDESDQKASDALILFAAMPATTKLERARANAVAHRQWIRLVKAELDRLRSPRARAGVRRPTRKPRPGYLQTEAKAFRAARPRDGVK